MATFLKRGAAVTVRLGPFLDKTDGVTEETALGNIVVEISKNHGAFGTRNSGSANAHDAEGWYSVVLDATDTGTLGPLIIKSHDSATHLPVWREFIVVPANVYDGLVNTGTTDPATRLEVDLTRINNSAASSSTAQLGVNLVNISGSAVSTTSAQLGVNVVQAATTPWNSGAITASTIASNAITASTIAADAIGASELAADAVTEIVGGVWNALRSSYTGSGSFGEGVASVTGAVGSVTGNVGGNVTGSVGSVTGNVGGNVAGSVGSLGATAKTDVTVAVWSATRSSYTTAGTFGQGVASVQGNVTGSVDSVTGAVGSVTGNVGGNVSGSVGSVTGAVASVTGNVGGNVAGSVGSLGATAKTDVTAAVWNGTRSSYVTAGSFGEGVASVQGNVTGSVASVTGAVGSVTGNVGGNVSGSVGSVTGAVGSVTGNVGGNVTGSIGSLAAQAKADVNAEVLDTLVTDTYAEAGAVPAATSSLKDKINWLFALARNKMTQTSTTTTLRNDADSADIASSTVSDDGTTATRGEWS